MTSKTVILPAAVSSLFMLTTMSFAADDNSSEKCYGVTKAGKNDCAGAAHACAGQPQRTRAQRSSSSYPRAPASASWVARSLPESDPDHLRPRSPLRQSQPPPRDSGRGAWPRAGT